MKKVISVLLAAMLTFFMTITPMAAYARSQEEINSIKGLVEILKLSATDETGKQVIEIEYDEEADAIVASIKNPMITKSEYEKYASLNSGFVQEASDVIIENFFGIFENALKAFDIKADIIIREESKDGEFLFCVKNRKLYEDDIANENAKRIGDEEGGADGDSRKEEDTATISICTKKTEEYEKNIDLYAQCGREMWRALDWKSVIVPCGIWKIGEDIPSGKWKIEPAGESSIDVLYGTITAPGGANIRYDQAILDEHLVSRNSAAYPVSKTAEMEIELKHGAYLYIKYGSARLTPLEKKSLYKFSEESTMDVRGMQYEDLVKKRKEISSSSAWFELKLGKGVYKIGDTNEMMWSITAVPGDYSGIAFSTSDKIGKEGIPLGEEVFFGVVVNEKDEDFNENTDTSSFFIDPREVNCFEIIRGTALITPFVGKNDILFE